MVLIYPAGIGDPPSGIKTACVQPGQCPAKLWARLSDLQDFIDRQTWERSLTETLLLKKKKDFCLYVHFDDAAFF